MNKADKSADAEHRSPGVYTYFPGCSQMATHRGYDVSTRSVAKALGVELVELDDWNCCGATAYVAINAAVGIALDDDRMGIFAPDNCSVTTLENSEGVLSVVALGQSAETKIN